MNGTEELRDWIAIGIAVGGVVTYGYWLYLTSVRKNLEGQMSRLQSSTNQALGELRAGLATKVEKEDQRLVDADLKREITGVRDEISELRRQTHTDSMAVVQSISTLQTTLTNAITEALRNK